MSKPVHVDNPVCAAAFSACVNWAWGEPQLRRRFEKETGRPRLQTAGVLVAIDEASGYTRQYMEAFVEWVIVNIWGAEPEEPTPCQ